MFRVRTARIGVLLLISLAIGMGIIDGGIVALSKSGHQLMPKNSPSPTMVPQANANQTAGVPSWDGAGLWNLRNVNNSSVTFLSNTIARFTNFQYTWPPAVSIASKQNWTVQSRLVLQERVRAWNFTNVSESYAWQTALDWGSGNAVIGYGTDNSHSPATGVLAGGECFLGTLSTQYLVGQWITVNFTLSAPSKTIYFSTYDSNGVLLGSASTRGQCGTMFGSNPARVLFFSSFGIVDVDWIRVTSDNNVLLFDDFLNGQPRLLVSSAPYSWNFDSANTTGWTPIVGWNSAASRPEYPQSCRVVAGEYSLTTCEPLYRSRNFTDLIFEAQVRMVNASGTPIWGIGFRENPAGPAYTSIVNATHDRYTLPQGYSFEFIGSTAYLYKCEESPTIVCSVLASALSNGTNIYAENTLKVVAIGPDIQIFLNWAKIMEVHDYQFPSGQVELFSVPNGCGASGCASVTSNFDNVAITPLQSSAIFDDFSGTQLGPEWKVENLGGNYSVANSQLTLSTSGPAVTVYRPFTPQTGGFEISARVQSLMLAGFALRIQTTPPPIFGSTFGAQVEFDSTVENKSFLAAWQPTGGGWSWKPFYGPSVTNTWFVLDMTVQKDPFTITFSALSDSGTLLGGYTVSNLGFNYTSISYLCLEAWSNPLQYNIDWIRVNNLPPFPLSADFQTNPGSPVTGQPVTFSSTASGGTPAYSYSWNFGDGAMATGATSVHSFHSSGNFTVTLAISDSGPSTFIATHIVSVTPGPSFNQTLTFGQITVNASGYFTYNPNTRILSGSITVRAVNTTTLQILLSRLFNISTIYPFGGTPRFVLVIPDNPVDLALSCHVNLASNRAGCDLSRNPDVAHRGQVDIVDFGMIAANYGTSQGSPGYNPALDLTAGGAVGIVAVSIAALNYGAQVFT